MSEGKKRLQHNTDIAKKFNDKFAERLRTLLYETKTTQKDLSHRLGISRQAVSGYINGTSQPDYDKLLIISDFFGVSTDYLLGKVDVPTLDVQLQQVCEYTGLSEKSVNTLSTIRKFKGDEYTILNQILEHNDFIELLDTIYSHLWNADVNHYRIKNNEVEKSIAEIYSCKLSEIKKYLESSSQLAIQSKIMDIVKDLKYYTKEGS